jgi:hypothetical protein
MTVYLRRRILGETPWFLSLERKHHIGVGSFIVHGGLFHFGLYW